MAIQQYNNFELQVLDKNSKTCRLFSILIPVLSKFFTTSKIASYNVNYYSKTNSNMLRTKKKKMQKNYTANHFKTLKSAKIAYFITIVVVSEAEKIIPLLEKIAKKRQWNEKLVQLDIVAEIPQETLSENKFRKEDEKYELIFLNFFKTSSLFCEDQETSEKLTSNGFTVKTIRRKLKEGELLKKAEEWFHEFLDYI